MSSDDDEVTSPSTCARTSPSIFAMLPMSVPAPMPPNDPENASACTLFLSPLSFASIRTGPDRAGDTDDAEARDDDVRRRDVLADGLDRRRRRARDRAIHPRSRIAGHE